MKDIYEVLRQKESELQQLQEDVDALLKVAHLLSDEKDKEAASHPASSSAAPTTAAADTPGQGTRGRQFP